MVAVATHHCQDAPLPHFEGIAYAKSIDPPSSGSSNTPVVSDPTGSEPTITEGDRTKYTSMFMACGPVNGLLDGDSARGVFLKSKLPVDKLSQIWGLADTKVRGSLDLANFIIAMHYVHRIRDGSITTLPTSLPPSLLKAVSRPTVGAGQMSSPALDAQTLARQATGGNMGSHNSAVVRQTTGSIGLRSSPLAKQSTGGVSTDTPWEISPEEKAKFDRFFDQLDTKGSRFLEGEEACRFFMNSRRLETELAQIWDLADITQSGRLGKDEFAVAMLLINRRNASNAPIPETLPLSLVPPSLRKQVTQPKSAFSEIDIFSLSDDKASFKKAEPEQISKLECEVQPSSAKDLRGGFKQSDAQFDNLWNLIPETSPKQSWKEPTGIQDLLGLDVDMWTKSTTPKQDQLDARESELQKESKAVKNLQTERTHLESETSRVQEIRAMMEQRLSNLKSQQERESKNIQDLNASLTTMESEVSTSKMAIAVSKRELQAAQADKAAFLEALGNGQEESLELKVIMQRNHDEVEKLRADLVAGMSILGFDPLDFPGTTGSSGGGKRAPTETRQDIRSARGPQYVMEDLLPSSQKRNPQFREPEPPRRVQGLQDHRAWQD
ncbi:MAG: hypothetical protein J3R72DRAFT_212489 [Linnemannia gamsii]|nr:MAG: hypothetical protein J3R72DRAFT_212489 [Linnemannia gamsii]